MPLAILEAKLSESGILTAIQSVCAGETECYLVGGAIRDCLLGRELNDFDFCFPAEANLYAGQIAERLGATWFVLDAERQHSRLVFKCEGEKLTCDFAPFRAPSLESDLRKRDFTINAMAIACHRNDIHLIDPMHGQDDLNARQLRVCSEYSFQEDPLRCLKVVRHAADLEFNIDPETMRLLVDSVSQIDQVAAERIRTEISKAVGCGQPLKAFELLGLTGLHRELFGSVSPESFAAALVMVRQLDTVFKALKSGTCGRIVMDYFGKQCEENVSVGVALMLAAFFRGYRPVALKSVLTALRFSKRTIGLIDQLMSLDAEWAESLLQVADKLRSRARWLDDTGREPLATAIFLPLIASGSMQDNLLKSELLIDSYITCAGHGKLAELVDGKWFTTELGLDEGPQIGRLQALLHRAEISGEATTPEEAQRWLLYNKNSFDKDFG
ncbi:MAG: hypothetical protein C0615_02895 [Desulfuromonas sp.]|nr:MAG: hypothetical protein C0615_02895 [Desulfuromonas sp.]